jgi:hypothetical protein
MPSELLFQEGAPMICPMCGVVCRKRRLDCPSMTTCSIRVGRGERRGDKIAAGWEINKCDKHKSTWLYRFPGSSENWN